MRKEEIEKRMDYLHDLSLFDGLKDGEQAELNNLEREYAFLLKAEAKIKESEQNEKSRRVKQSRGRGRYGESRLAKKVGGVVAGRSKYILLPSGRGIKIDCQHPPDVLTDMFAFESKWLKEIPVGIKKIMAQAIRNTPEGFTPVGVLGDRTQREVYYILTERDFLDLHVGNSPENIPDALQSKSRPLKGKSSSLL